MYKLRHYGNALIRLFLLTIFVIIHEMDEFAWLELFSRPLKLHIIEVDLQVLLFRILLTGGEKVRDVELIDKTKQDLEDALNFTLNTFNRNAWIELGHHIIRERHSLLEDIYLMTLKHHAMKE